MTEADIQPTAAVPAGAEDANRDLGFGAVVARESRQRLLNRDGSFNVAREGLSWFVSHSLYHDLLTLSWPRFLSLVVAFYLVCNTLFALAFVACGAGALAGTEGMSAAQRFWPAFFFSVQTFATIGYGVMAPKSLAANVLVTLESLVGLLGFALATGLLFSRFARPTARILFSENALISPYRGITAFQFRIANGRSNELVEVAAKLMFSSFRADGTGIRDFIPLKLERDRVSFFPLSWTVVHAIEPDSPLFGLTGEDLKRSDAEFLVLLTGFDETFSQTVHTRSSYKADEVVWGAKFANVFNPPGPDGTLSIDVRRLHNFEHVPLPEPPASRQLSA